MRTHSFLINLNGNLYLIAESFFIFSLILQAANYENLSSNVIYWTYGIALFLLLVSIIIEKIYLRKYPDEKNTWKNYFKAVTFPATLSILIAGIIYMILILTVF